MDQPTTTTLQALDSLQKSQMPVDKKQEFLDFLKRHTTQFGQDSGFDARKQSLNLPNIVMSEEDEEEDEMDVIRFDLDNSQCSSGSAEFHIESIQNSSSSSRSNSSSSVY
mmetsp:Transcript_24751/g.38539  ORF Transcript_24751/g.38539 Transcript_24751/m.38539 type:complete len:110 (-) Transcript_24751:123-452(-)